MSDAGECDLDDADDTRKGHVELQYDHLPAYLRPDVGKDLYPLPLTPHGDLIASLVATVDEYNANGANRLEYLWLGASCFMFVLCVTTQWALSFALMVTAVGKAAKPYEDGKGEAMAAALRAAIAAGVPLEEDQPGLVVCRRSDVKVVPSYLMIEMLWVMHMMDEFMKGVWLLLVTQRVSLQIERPDDSDDSSGQEMDSGTDGRDMLHQRLMHDFSHNGTRFYRIMFLTPRLKHICLWIAILKLVVTLWIAWVGTTFLIFAQQTQVLVLKTMVCSFFLLIGDMLFKWLLSEAKMERLKQTSICFRDVKSEDWSLYGSTWVRLSLVVAITSIIWFGIFRSLRDFRLSCLQYKNAFPMPHDPDSSGQWWFF